MPLIETAASATALTEKLASEPDPGVFAERPPWKLVFAVDAALLDVFGVAPPVPDDWAFAAEAFDDAFGVPDENDGVLSRTTVTVEDGAVSVAAGTGAGGAAGGLGAGCGAGGPW